jgi:hypothetical protein
VSGATAELPIIALAEVLVPESATVSWKQESVCHERVSLGGQEMDIIYRAILNILPLVSAFA